jgi:Transposase DDE domain.
LLKRQNHLFEKMTESSSSIIHRITDNVSEQRGFYRFLENEKIEISDLINSQTQIPKKELIGRDVLCLIDGSSFNMSSAYGRMNAENKGKLGVLENNQSPGILTSVALSIDEKSSEVLGITDILVYNRKKREASRDKNGYRKLSFLEKESSKFYINAKNSKVHLEGCNRITIVTDRDGDRFETIQHLDELEGINYVIRLNDKKKVRYNGKVCDLKDLSNELEIRGEYELEIKALNHKVRKNRAVKKRKGRRSRMLVKHACLDQIEVPRDILRKDKTRQPIKGPIYYVEVCEHPDDIPQGEDQIVWKILTNRLVTTLEEAKHIIEIYSQRWHIEQLFRVCKTKGMEVESTQLESVEAIQRLLVMTISVACRIMQLTLARGIEKGRDINLVFEKKEQEILEKICKKMNGKTKLSQNPFSKNELSWASWIIGRLGGWKGYYSQGPPGPITIIRGYRKFQIFKEASLLFNSE